MPSRLPRVPRVDEANALLDRAGEPQLPPEPGTDLDPVEQAVILRDLAVLEVLYGAGLRVAECCGLRFDDCDLRRGLVTVLGKGSKVRRVPIGEPAVDALRAWLDRGRAALLTSDSPEDVVFVNRRGHALTPA